MCNHDTQNLMRHVNKDFNYLGCITAKCNKYFITPMLSREIHSGFIIITIITCTDTL